MKNYHVKYGQLDTRELSDASKEKMAQRRDNVFQCFKLDISLLYLSLLKKKKTRT